MTSPLRLDDLEPEARAILCAIGERGVDWVLLSTPAVGGGDIDIGASARAPEVVAALASGPQVALAIMMCEYDIGGAHAVWFVRHGSRRIVHLDLLADHTGIGRLALPTTALLDAARLGKSPSRSWLLAHQVAKRLLKADWDRLRSVSAADISPEPFLEMFGEGADLVLQLVRSGATEDEWRRNQRILRRGVAQQRRRHAGGRTGLIRRRAGRILRRLVHPVGVWIHVENDSSAAEARTLEREIARSIGRVAVHHARGAGLATAARSYLFRLRPGVFISYGPASRIRAGAVVWNGIDEDPKLEGLFSALAARLGAKLP